MVKLDIFTDVLNPLQTKTPRQVWDTMGAEKQKQFQPFVVQRWLSGCTDSSRIIALDDTSNKVIFSNRLTGLHLLILMHKAMGKNTRAKVSYPKTKPTSSKSMVVKVVASFYDQSEREALMTMETLSNEDILEMAEDLGMDSKEMAELRKQL